MVIERHRPSTREIAGSNLSLPFSRSMMDIVLTGIIV
jgi:hypothetical protein